MSSSHAKTIITDAPTYWPTPANRLPEILDFFLSNLPNHLKTQTTNLNDPASDHTPVLLQINTQAPSKPSFKQINWPKFRNILSNNTNLNIKLKTKEDIDLAITSLTENILLAKNNSLFPTLNTIKSNHITPEISQLIIEKRRARNKWQHSHYPDDRHIYNSLSNKLKKLLKKHKNVLYESHLSSLSPNNGFLWRKTKSLLRHKTIFPPLQRQNCNLAVSAQDKAELLAQHFSNVFKSHSILPENSHLDQGNKYINSPLPMSLPAKHTTPNEIFSIIKSLKINKSPGHDQISNKIVKNFPPKTIIQFIHIYNATLRLSHFPSTWKSAVFIPILKPSKPPDKAESYKPICVLPVLRKILEKILLKRLLKISNEQNALPDFQFGFRPKHASFHQLHRVVALIASSLETKKYCCAVFLDVAQAFDSVWHTGLLYKLKKIFPAPYYLLLKSYIENRSFNVKIESTFSNSYDILAGVPQGSDIAPFLYIIFTADIPTTENTTMDEEIDKSSFFKLTENMIKSLIPKIGKQAKFLSNLNELKSHGDINNIPDEFNQSVQNQTDIHQQLIDIDNINEIQVLYLNTINIINQATEYNNITNGVTQINSHINHQIDIDFDRMHPGKKVSLFYTFTNFVNTISKYMNKFKPRLEKFTKCTLLLRELNTPY
ncbi:hypothetical protein QTP88_004564 [Uroleucon formosanum]